MKKGNEKLEMIYGEFIENLNDIWRNESVGHFGNRILRKLVGQIHINYRTRKVTFYAGWENESDKNHYDQEFVEIDVLNSNYREISWDTLLEGDEEYQETGILTDEMIIGYKCAIEPLDIKDFDEVFAILNEHFNNAK